MITPLLIPRWVECDEDTIEFLVKFITGLSEL